MGSTVRTTTRAPRKSTTSCSSMTSAIETDVISIDSKGRTHTSSTVKTTVVPASSCVSTTPTSTTRTTAKASRASHTSPTTNTNKSKHTTNGKSVWRSGTVSCTEPFQPVFTRFVPPNEHTTTTSFVDCEIINL